MSKFPSLSEVIAKAEKRSPDRRRGRGAYSPLYIWMRHQNPADFQRAIDGLGWQDLTQAIVRAGITNGNGDPPPVGTVRNTWWRVQRAAKRERDKAVPTLPRKAKPIPQVRDALPPTPAQPELKPNEDTPEALTRFKDLMNKRSGR